MQFLLQLDLRDPLPLSSAFRDAFLFVCEGYEDERGCMTWEAGAGANAIAFTSGRDDGQAPAPVNATLYPERAVAWSRYVPMAEDDEVIGLINPELWEQIEREMVTIPEDEDIEIMLLDHSGAPDTLLIGGDPQWLQDDETPTCPRCGGPTRLLAQVDALIDEGGGDAESYWMPFGSGGVGYMFICDRECDPSGSAFLWQTS